MRARFFTILLLSITTLVATAAEPADTTARKKGFFARVLQYFSESNNPSPSDKFDFSVIGGPHYSSDSKFGIGVMGAGLYRASRNDTLTPVSQVSIYADVTTAAHFKVGICGTHIFPGDRSRLTYDLSLSSIKTSFWGIGYDECRYNDNESKYKYLNVQLLTYYRWSLGDHFYAGPVATIDFIKGSQFEKPWLWHGEAARTFNWSLGGLVEYDSRDHLTNPYRGTFVRIQQQFYPRFLGNKYAFSATTVHASQYIPAWRGGTFAVAVDGNFTYGNTPWGLLSTFGGRNTMRGYFEGRYRNKSAITACVELRQHVWRRNGVVVWGGAGTVFDKFKEINSRTILPNYGVGYRWEFKQRVNVRLDLGFGRGVSGFIFSINEAF